MERRHYLLATAGHVDHGKSALVKALTGTDPDRLPEEKARGITIDLGFAHLEIPARAPQATALSLGIVDVPGHEDFVKNMVAGVGAADIALLVVAADDGWMPQTEEHLQILTYLGVPRAVVALTKADLAGTELTSRIQAVREQLRNTSFSGAPVIPTAIPSGAGLAELKGALAEVLSGAPVARDIGKPRLPVDRAFVLRGIGTVVTGTLQGGTLHRGQAVVLQPGGALTRIRTVQSHHREVESVGPGMRAALNLTDVAVAQNESGADGSQGVRRGQVLTLGELGTASSAWDVVLEKSARLIGSQARAARPLKDGLRVRIHHGSGNVPARISLSGSSQLGPGEQAFAQIRFESPVFAFGGDRFIVRDGTEEATLAGGVILEHNALRKGFHTPAREQFLRRRAQTLGDPGAVLEGEFQRHPIARRSGLLSRFSWSDLEISTAISKLQQDGKILLFNDLIAEVGYWRTLRQKAVEAIDAHHRAHPEQSGLPLVQWRALLQAQLPFAEAFDALAADLGKTEFVQAGNCIKRASHRPALPPALAGAGVKLRAALSLKPMDPPSRKELAPDALSQQALRFLLQSGEAVELGPEVVLLRDSYTRAALLIAKHLRERGPATVSDLRQAVGASRRIVVPLLERLDREGVTRRQGDTRVLGRTAVPGT